MCYTNVSSIPAVMAVLLLSVVVLEMAESAQLAVGMVLSILYQGTGTVVFVT